MGDLGRGGCGVEATSDVTSDVTSGSSVAVDGGSVKGNRVDGRKGGRNSDSVGGGITFCLREKNDEKKLVKYSKNSIID